MPAASITIMEIDFGTSIIASMVAWGRQFEDLAQFCIEECVLLNSTNSWKMVDP